MESSPYQFQCHECSKIYNAEDGAEQCACGGYGSPTDDCYLQKAKVKSSAVADALRGVAGSPDERVAAAMRAIVEHLQLKFFEIAEIAGIEQKTALRYQDRLIAEWESDKKYPSRSNRGPSGAQLVWELTRAEHRLLRDYTTLRERPTSESADRLKRMCHYICHGGPNQISSMKIHWKLLKVWQLDTEPSKPSELSQDVLNALRHYRAINQLALHDYWLIDPLDLDEDANIWGISVWQFYPHPQEIDWTDFPEAEPPVLLKEPCPACNLKLIPLHPDEAPGRYCYVCPQCEEEYLHSACGLRNSEEWYNHLCQMEAEGHRIAELMYEQLQRNAAFRKEWPHNMKEWPASVDEAFRSNLQKISKLDDKFSPNERQELLNAASASAAKRWRDLAMN